MVALAYRLILALVILLPMIFVVPVLLWSSSTEPLGPPLFQIAETERDLGDVTVSSTDTHSATFRFQNCGLSRLQISRVIASCGCADVKIDKMTLEPGEDGQVHVHILAKVPEERRASVTLDTNDPIHPQVKLELAWRAVAPLEFDSYRVDFGTLRPGESAERTLELVRREDERWPSCQITGLDITPPANLSAEWAPPDTSDRSDAGSDDERQLRIRLLADHDSGERTGRVSIELDNCWQPTLSIPVSWRVRDVIEVEPASLFLRTDSQRQTGIGKVVLSTDPGEELEVQRAELLSLAAGSEVTWNRLDSARVVLEVGMKLPAEPGLHKSELQVVCSRPAERTLVVPVTAYVGSPAATAR